MSGNEALARGAYDAGCKVAAAYPGTPSTEILEYTSQYKDMYTEWSVNEKVSLEVAIGASLAGSRAFCAMKHVGLNVASDALMTQTLIGVRGGLVIAVADDVGLSSSQNEQDSRYWGRFAHIPVLEPADSQEAYDMVKYAFDLSEQFDTPVLLRITTRVCHVKSVITTSEHLEKDSLGFVKDQTRLVMTPANAKHRIPVMHQREANMRDFSNNECPLNTISSGKDNRIGYITSGPAFLHVSESFPDAPVLKMGLSHPVPIEKIREFATSVDQLVIVEETEPLVETELKAAGIKVIGKDILPIQGELAPNILRPVIAEFLGEAIPDIEQETRSGVPIEVNLPSLAEGLFPRPPTMCVACPHLGIYYTLSKVKNTIISGDIGCYTLGAGHPWNAMDTCVCMGASMGVALGLDKGRTQSDENKSILAVIGDSTFMHMGMQGLLDITYNKGNVTILLLDNRAVGMTGGQENPGTGRNIHGDETQRIDFRKLCEALGVNPDRIHEVNPYEMPTLFKAIRQEVKINEPSVIITNQPCVLVDYYKGLPSYEVIDDKCTGCTNCLDIGCPAIMVTRRETVVKPNGSTKELAFVRIESAVCTGCDLCPKTCGPDAIIPIEGFTRD